MSNITKDFFMNLSTNKLLNAGAQKWGFKLGAAKVVAGTTIEETIESIKKINAQGISCTIDNLGEFVHVKEEAIQAKHQILSMIDAIQVHEVDAHISLKPSQLGLDIDLEFCYDNLYKIVEKAHTYDVFINIDMEDFERLHPSFEIMERLLGTFDNIGTVIQAYFYRAEDDLEKYRDLRLRIVKGAYKEEPDVAYQTKEEIDANFINLIEWHLLNGKFTSIATHDHHVIEHVKRFVRKNNVSRDKFEFQMLYGFREDMHVSLVKEGYHFCTYVPFGDDWYGYFMRRLAERPQNINLITKQVFNKKTNTVLGVALGAFLLGRWSKKDK